MKTLFTFCISLLTLAAIAQVPTNFGTNAEDGIIYQNYNLIDHGVVSSVRFQAQNAISEGTAIWEFYTDNYNQTWRPYTADDTLSGYDAIIDPSAETASARYNSFLGGGASGLLPAVQAGYYYTCVIGNNVAADNFMSIIETDFAPVAIDTVYITPTNPTVADNITITVELDGAMMLSPSEHVFIRVAGSPDFTIAPTFNEVTNFANGVGTLTVPAGTVPAGLTAYYYALVTEQANPQHETIDYFTLYFANNGGANYQFTVSSITGVEDIKIEYGIVQANGMITVKNSQNLQSVELISVDGQRVANVAVVGGATIVSTEGLASGIYVLNLVGKDNTESIKLFVD
jgi:hypothetical protein